MPKAKNIPTGKIIEALKKNNFIRVRAADALGISLATLKRRINKNPELQEAFVDFDHEIVELARSKLFEGLEIVKDPIKYIKLALNTEGANKDYPYYKASNANYDIKNNADQLANEQEQALILETLKNKHADSRTKSRL